MSLECPTRPTVPILIIETIRKGQKRVFEALLTPATPKSLGASASRGQENKHGILGTGNAYKWRF